MREFQSIAAEFLSASDYPIQAVARHNVEGKKVIGCVPYFVPMELVHAAGMYPVELWGGGVEPSQAYRYYPTFYCSVVVTLLERALRGDYDFLSGVIVPTTCDPLRNLEENWKFAVDSMPVIPLVQPANRRTAPAEKYYLTQLRRVQEALEEISGQVVTDKALRESINAYNAQRAMVRRFNELVPVHLDVITPKVRHAVLKCAHILPVEKYCELLSLLIEQLEAMPEHEFDGVKLVATGIIVDSDGLYELLRSHGFAIVADDMPSESKRFERDVPGHVDPFVSIARVWPQLEGCSMLFDPEKKRGAKLVELAEKTGADGVLVNIIKFCEEDEFDYPILKKQLESASLPHLYLELEQQTRVNAQADTRIQAFKELFDR